jgi:transposase InsO family protein
MANYGVYGARKVWLQLNREGVPVARCAGERLMGELGLAEARRGRRHRTTRPDGHAARPADLVGHRFNPPAPDRTWVADFTYVPTWSGTVYVAFVIDAYSRRILGWRAATSVRTALVLERSRWWPLLRFTERGGAGCSPDGDALDANTYCFLHGSEGTIVGWRPIVWRR